MNKLTKTILTCWMAAAVGAVAQFQGQDHMEPAPEAEIVGMERSEDGVDLFFHTQPGGVYSVWVSCDGKTWEYLETAAEIEDGLYHIFDGQALGCPRRYYRVAVFNPNCNPLPGNWVDWVVDRVRYSEYLDSAQEAKLRAATEARKASLDAERQADSQVRHFEKLLADCLKEVSLARLAWQQAKAEKAAADKAVADEETRQKGRKENVETTKKERDAAAKRADQWEHEMNVLLDWAAKFEREGDSRKAAEMRANAANAQEKYEAWSGEESRLNDEISYWEGTVTEGEGTLAGLRADATAKGTVVATAKAAYDAVKGKCDALRGGLDGAKKAAKRAEDAAKDELKKWQDARDTAIAEGRHNRDNPPPSTDGGSGGGEDPEPEPEAWKPTPRAIAVAKFLEHIRKNGGLDAWESAVRTIYGYELSASLITLDGIGAAMKAWAQGKSHTAAGNGAGAMAAGGLQLGYGLIAGWVQGHAENATRGLANRKIAELAVLETPNRGDAKYRDEGKGSATLLIRNADGKVTVMSYRRSQPLTTGIYKVPGLN